MNITIKRILYFILGLVIIAIIAYPKLELTWFSSIEESEKAKVVLEPKKLTVSALKISFQPLDYLVRVTGTIIADETVALSSEVSGKIEKIHFEEGMFVKKGETLVSLNDDEVSAELEKLQYNNKLFQDTEFRQKKLLQSEAISQEEYEIALATLNTSLADIRLSETRKQKHKIISPFAGKVGLRQVSEGSYITPGSSIATLYSIDPIKIDFQIPGRYLSDVNIGDKLIFNVDAYQQSFEGSIYAIEPQIDPSTRSIRLRAISSNEDQKLLPGQFVKIKLILDQVSNAILVPTICIIPELNGTKVFVYEDGKAVNRIVELGVRNANNVQIVSGLEPGDIVITSGLLQVRNGSEVNVKF